MCVCVLAVLSERGEATCPGCSSVRARLTAEVGVHLVLCQAAFTQKNTHTHTDWLSITCGKCLCVTGCWGNIFWVRFMHFDKVSLVKDLQCGVWPGFF